MLAVMGSADNGEARMRREPSRSVGCGTASQVETTPRMPAVRRQTTTGKMEKKGQRPGR